MKACSGPAVLSSLSGLEGRLVLRRKSFLPYTASGLPWFTPGIQGRFRTASDPMKQWTEMAGLQPTWFPCGPVLPGKGGVSMPVSGRVAYGQPHASYCIHKSRAWVSSQVCRVGLRYSPCLMSVSSCLTFLTP